jgi:hypothetical protein
MNAIETIEQWAKEKDIDRGELERLLHNFAESRGYDADDEAYTYLNTVSGDRVFDTLGDLAEADDSIDLTDPFLVRQVAEFAGWEGSAKEWINDNFKPDVVELFAKYVAMCHTKIMIDGEEYSIG